MKHVAWKFYTFGQVDKEEQWLNEMAARGLMLTDVFAVRYTFEQGTPGEYGYRIELLDNLPSHPESARYLRFLEETGVECVGTFARWVYLRRKTAYGPFELYSDIDSKIRHYKRITLIANVMTIMMLCFTVMFLCEAFSQYTGYLDWYRRGFSCKPYHIRYFMSSGTFLLIAAIMQVIALPVKKAIHGLKKERTIRE